MVSSGKRMAAGGCSSSSDDVVIKSPNDSRSYRYLELDNGLSAILVHDPDIYSEPHSHTLNKSTPEDDDDCDDDCDEDNESDHTDDEDEDSQEDEDGDDELAEAEGVQGDVKPKGQRGDSQTKKAAAAMCVGIGSFSDPVEAQGLAHFLEHMLFMGSTNFPDENEYDNYLSKHGGSSNAFTETEHTCYYFEVKREFLKGALTRFSQFFISPLVKVEAMDREVLAVDSEFNQVVQNDACRLQQLQCHTSAPGHPFNGFFWGNKKSLADAMEKGINLREQILKLYSDNYHGGLMKLVVIGGETLDELQNWVSELFSNVRKGPHMKSEVRMEVPIWEAGKVYRLASVKDVHTLDLSWTLPCLRPDYLKKSEDYLAHLIGHEGKGSLHFFLKAKGWATSISAGVGDEGMHRSSVAYIFGMSIRLTDSGLEKVSEIIGFVYQYLKLLRQTSPKEWIFKELQDIGIMEFRFAEEQPQDDYAAELAGNMLVYPAEHVIYGDYAYTVFDPEMIMYVLSFFTPENMRVDVVSKSFTNSEDFKREPWFGSQYAEDDISPFLMELWRNSPEIDAALHLPSKNEFIPCDFSLRADYAPDSLANTYPSCILDDPILKLWYKLDKTFKLPRANAYFRLTTKGGYDNVKSCLLTELFIQLLKDELNEIVYQASVAKLETSVSLHRDKLELKVYGFNDKLPILLCKVLEKAKNFLPNDDRFKVIKEDLVRTLRNTNIKPLNHSTYLRLQVLCKHFWDVGEKLSLLNELSVSELKSFIPQLLSEIYIEGLCHGNLLPEEATDISNIVRSNFSAQPLPVEMRHEERVLSLPSGANFVINASVKNKSETNSVVELYFQIEQEHGEESIKLRALSDIFNEIVGEPFFNQLRTKEQLGYVVECGPRITYRVFGFCFCVQSSKYNPVYLQGRIDNFIGGLEEFLDALDSESFENYKSGLTAKLLEKDPSLTYETNRFWSQIVDKRYMFNLSKNEAKALEYIQKNDVIEWYKTYIRQPSPKCRRLSVRVWGCNTDLKDAKTEVKAGQVVEDLAAFKASSIFYQDISVGPLSSLPIDFEVEP